MGLDHEATGWTRREMLNRLIEVGEGYVLLRDGRPRGYAISRLFGRGHVIGPVVTESPTDARALIEAALAPRECFRPGRYLYHLAAWGVARRHRAAASWRRHHHGPWGPDAIDRAGAHVRTRQPVIWLGDTGMLHLEMYGTDIPNAGPGEAVTTVGALATPALLLAKDWLDRNLARLSSRIAAQGVVLRPHMKTAKSIEVARRASPFRAGADRLHLGRGGEGYFARHDFRDMTYAVGLAPHTAARAMRFRKAGVDLKVLLNSPDRRRCWVRLAAPLL